MEIKDLIEASSGRRPSDIRIDNARLINVFSGRIIDTSIAICGGRIAGFGDFKAKKVIDAKKRFVCPGLIDAHVHIESSMLAPPGLAGALLPCGTTSIVADPHEIANVMGAAGINYMMEASSNLPLNVYFMLPSCVPATDLETSGASLDPEDLIPFYEDEKVLGLAEVMNFPGVIGADGILLKKIEGALKFRKRVDGHAPGISGRDLFAYVSASITSDHECTDIREAQEKLECGMHIMIREGTGAKNLDALLPIINEKTAQRILFCTDDRHPDDILRNGHIDSMVRRAIKAGIDPATAIRIATLNAAEYFGIRDAGAIAPGRRADLIIFSDLFDFMPELVMSSGIFVAEKGSMTTDYAPAKPPETGRTVFADISASDLRIRAESEKIRVIGIIPNQITTESLVMRALIKDGFAVTDPSRDLLKIAVFERHGRSGNIGLGFVKGLGLEKGAVASTVAHDSHNIIVAGTNDEDMKAAALRVVAMGGGMAVSSFGKILAELALPIAGLMSNLPHNELSRKIEDLNSMAKSLGAKPPDPFMALSFLALPVIGRLKITDMGLVDTGLFDTVPLFL